ncbi:hypothetical protein SDC9_120559 [bioreactor metagenome]|uniref:Uncharacterized protein n=3 Tax=root TaxID=1 RepID=A0A1W1IDI8_9LACT|nr:hypothetical protein [Trichococcus pasteurii]SFF05061.1 hypothetical protein SAMN04488086_12238 [Trichococcus pasteurii]SLM51065.1 Hypothetical protein TPAS_740 [Trichococcus pasteurii]SSB91946.1 Hypothetical protein TPAS_740 [Trichococcus pasteurii]
MLTIQFIISILMVLVLVMLIINTIRKYDSVLRADVKRLRAENEALRKELLKRGIVEYVQSLMIGSENKRCPYTIKNQPENESSIDELRFPAGLFC